MAVSKVVSGKYSGCTVYRPRLLLTLFLCRSRSFVVSGMFTSRRLNENNVIEWETLGSDGARDVKQAATYGFIGWLLVGWWMALIGVVAAGKGYERVRVVWKGGGASVLRLTMDDFSDFTASFY